jgi:hypothetical protein
MSEFTVRSDSGEMSGSNELYEWADKFYEQHRIEPLEHWSSDEQVWMAGTLWYDPAGKYRLNEAAKAILRRKEEDEPEQRHLAGIFDQIHSLLDQAEQQAKAKLEQDDSTKLKEKLNESLAKSKKLLSERDTARDALEESLESEKRLLSERDKARDASIKHYGKVEELQKIASELLSERDKLVINLNSKLWLLRRLLLLMIGVKR